MTAIAFALVIGLVGLTFAWPSTALAADPVTDEQLEEAAQRALDSAEELDAATERLEEAEARVEEVDALIAQNEERIAQIEAALPEQRDRAADSLVTLYKMSQDGPGLMDLVLSSDTFYELVSTLQYLDIIQGRNNDVLAELVSLDNELGLVRAQLAARREEAQAARAEAEDARLAAEEALVEAIAVREELERQAEEQAAVEEAERLAGSLPAIDWSVGQDAFVSTWGARIDAYLAGSPLAGYGPTFAAAAWAYGIDPRWSPAIANTESSRGANCFLPHNAWGWGQMSWSSWDEAIWAHVGGLASGYGYTISLAAAQRYCPPNANSWYATTLQQMLSM